MRNFTNPLDNIRVASPCSANWEEMFGDDRKRFCGDCKLNVYNLSNMTWRQAESLIISSEGRLCVRFFRRADGTVLTKNCPVGWAAVKQRVSRVAAAAFSIMIGFLSGLLAVRGTEAAISLLPTGNVPEPVSGNETTETTEWQGLPIVGDADVLEVNGQVDLRDVRRTKLKIKRTTR